VRFTEITQKLINFAKRVSLSHTRRHNEMPSPKTKWLWLWCPYTHVLVLS